MQRKLKIMKGDLSSSMSINSEINVCLRQLIETEMGGVLLWVYPRSAEVQSLDSCFCSLPFYVFFLWFISALPLLICPGRVAVQNVVGGIFGVSLVVKFMV